MREHGDARRDHYDETRLKFVRATPEPNATNNKRKKISIEFDDEYIKAWQGIGKVIICLLNGAPEKWE